MDDDDLFEMLRKNLYFFLVVLHELSMLLLIKIFRQQHKHATSFESIKQQEFSVVYNVFAFVVVELSVQNLNQEYPKSIGNKHVFNKRRTTKITAGNAKKLIPMNEQIAATNFPIYDDGTLSPYPTYIIQKLFFFLSILKGIISFTVHNVI